MERNPLTNSWINLLALAAGTTAAWVVSLSSGTLAGQLASVFLSAGTVVALLSHLQLWLRQREVTEQRELDELRNSRSESTLFDASPTALRARRTREQFDRFAVPTITFLLWVALGFAAWFLWRRIGKAPAVDVNRLAVILSTFSLISLTYFVLGKFAAGVAQHEGHRLLRPAASHLLFGSLLGALVVIAAAASWFNVPAVDLHTAHGLIAVLGLVFVETGANLILEIYRPRVKGQAVQPLYESRLLGLLSQPGGLFRTAAQTLDYQFGFKVSETWFYRYLEQKLTGLLLVQLIVVWISSAIVIIDPHEDAALERFGKPVPTRGILGPGLHLKWPWPIDRARVFSTREVRSFDVGFVPDPELAREDTLLWTRAHYKEELNLLVASREAGDSAGIDGEQSVPVNLLTVSIPVQYHITNLLQWAYGHAEGERLLPLIATREISHYLVSVDLDDVMSAGRRRAAEELRSLIQTRATEIGLGVEVLFVGLQDVHPPVPVADAYEAVIAATQERETKVLDAQGYRAEQLPRARAEGERRILEQRAQSVSRVASAGAQSAKFTNQVTAWRASPDVYSTRAYHDTLVRALAPVRKFVLATTNTQDQYWLNFEEKLRTDLLDVQVPTSPRPRP